MGTSIYTISHLTTLSPWWGPPEGWNHLSQPPQRGAEAPPPHLSFPKLPPEDCGPSQSPRSLSPHHAGDPHGHPWQAAVRRTRENRQTSLGQRQWAPKVGPTSLSRISLARSLMSCEGLKCSGSSSSCSAKACGTATHKVRGSATKTGHRCSPSVSSPPLLHFLPTGTASKVSLCGS